VGKITTLVRNTGSGISASFNNMNTAIINVWVKVLLYPLNQYLLIRITPFKSTLEDFRGKSKGLDGKAVILPDGLELSSSGGSPGG